MLFDVPAVQRALAADRLDGWLLYDFHGSNPIAATLAGLAGSSGKLTTRRWYYLIPASGAPRGLVHAIERHNLDGLPGTKEAYAGRRELEAGLRRLLDGCQRVAMEYSPQGAIPYVSRVDAGTFEAVRSLGVDIVSSGDLVQRFEASWSAEALASHRAASERLYRIKDRAFEALRSTMRERGAWDEYELQQKMMEWFSDEELVTDSPPVVAAMENAGSPHYLPSPEAHRVIRANELVLLDLWGKLPTDGAVFADITWVGFTGSSVPAEFSSAFGAIRDGRDAAIQLVQASARERRDLRGWQVDRAAREVIERAGYGKAFIHRTGHSLGGTVHGNGVHMDDYETHDDRRLLPGTGFTIEPGVYFDRFGVRTEVNIYYGDGEATVTGPAQTEIVTV
ncbi:MAG TPA: M24 family metallopeptidase [Vicinamibacterales bacterium]|jgi:Xaa-Pro aminopeptidase|nr:M24 family metallopeptidase [Vicinamibacterales bacterium]